MTGGKYGGLPEPEVDRMLAHSDQYSLGLNKDDAYTVLWWLADNGWLIVRDSDA